jgi:hypothetical protein
METSGCNVKICKEAASNYAAQKRQRTQLASGFGVAAALPLETSFDAAGRPFSVWFLKCISCLR